MTPETLQELLNIHYFHSDNLGKIRTIAGTLSSHGYPSQIREFKQLLESYSTKPNAVITAEVINILERYAARRLDPATQSSRACVEIAKEVARLCSGHDPENRYRYRALKAVGLINVTDREYINNQPPTSEFVQSHKEDLLVSVDGQLFLKGNLVERIACVDTEQREFVFMDCNGQQQKLFDFLDKKFPWAGDHRDSRCFYGQLEVAWRKQSATSSATTPGLVS